MRLLKKWIICSLVVFSPSISISTDLIAAEAAVPAAAIQHLDFNQENVILLSRIKSKPGKRDEVIEIIKAFYAQVRELEPGCLVNIMHLPAIPPAPADTGSGAEAAPEQSTANEAANAGLGFKMIEPVEDTLVFYEVYRDRASANAHSNTPHFQVFIENLSPLLAEPISLEFLSEVASK